jgi:hypothetical protein
MEGIALIIESSIGFLLLIYAGFCWVKQGVHVKGKGWKSKEEMPKSFWFSIVLYLLIGLSMLVRNFLFPR